MNALFIWIAKEVSSAMVRLVGIAMKGAKRAPMREVMSARVSLKDGVVGEWRGHGGFLRTFQVTLLSREQWAQACEKLGVLLPWTARRANLLIEGMIFRPTDLGKIIVIGEVELEVTEETTPCPRMDEAYQGLMDVLLGTQYEWPAGVRCRVRKGGTISIGSSFDMK